MFGIIGGSGICCVNGAKEKTVKTPYGEAVLYLTDKMVFIPRHGKKHSVPPHMINYKANLWALKQAGVTNLLTFHASGIISDYEPGDFILLKDFISLNITPTFFDSFKDGMHYQDLSNPFDKKAGEKFVRFFGVKKGGIIATMPGPRFESKTEVKVLKSFGANLVNMTASYEIILANELGIHITSLAVGTNYAAGISKHSLTHEEVLGVMEKNREKISKLIEFFSE
ncbi:MTAP family purine nucleoside phosphorylase [Candidatus Micrarchaeota archaeon]|nr:MTAP family purine nucleoside phosphorylase [Candidatus Micrarchaeota archaeon]